MKRYTFLIIIIIVSLALLTKLVLLSKPIVVTDKSNSLMVGESRESPQKADFPKKHSIKRLYPKGTSKTAPLKESSELNGRKLRLYAQAYIKVQNYMARAGRNANYNATKKIVTRYGLSVEDYTRISTQMNKSPLFREEVQKLIHEMEGTQ